MDAKGGRDDGAERLRTRAAGERTAGPRPRGGVASRPRRVGDAPRVAPRPPRRRAGRARPAPPRRARATAGDAVIRRARESDNLQIAAIWNREAIGTAATTDTEPRSPKAQRAWLAAHMGEYPALVAVDGDEVVAFGALAPYRPKPSYARTVEDSVYVKDGWRGKGLGGLLLDALVEEQPAQPLAAPTVLHVDGVLHRARVRRLGAVGRESAEGDDLVAVDGDEGRVLAHVRGQPRALCLRAARLGVRGGRGADRLAIPDGGDLEVVRLARPPDHGVTRCGAGSPRRRRPSATSAPPRRTRSDSRGVTDATRARRDATSRAWASRSFASCTRA